MSYLDHWKHRAHRLGAQDAHDMKRFMDQYPQWKGDHEACAAENAFFVAAESRARGPARDEITRAYMYGYDVAMQRLGVE